jgi:hypothetical protein
MNKSTLSQTQKALQPGACAYLHLRASEQLRMIQGQGVLRWQIWAADQMHSQQLRLVEGQALSAREAT